MTEISIATARKLQSIIDVGLVSGMGRTEPGQMCVEAAVCFALGLPHGDDPKCVAQAVRLYKIRLNDAMWSSPAARAKGLRRVAVAQLGSLGVVNDRAFAELVAAKTIRVILPIALRAVASVHQDAEHKDALEQVATRCAAEGSRQIAISARDVAQAARRAAWNKYGADDAAAFAADDAADYAFAAAADYAAAARCFATRDEVLMLGAEICLEALRELDSPGVALLDQIEAEDEVLA